MLGEEAVKLGLDRIGADEAFEFNLSLSKLTVRRFQALRGLWGAYDATDSVWILCYDPGSLGRGQCWGNLTLPPCGGRVTSAS